MWDVVSNEMMKLYLLCVPFLMPVLIKSLWFFQHAVAFVKDEDGPEAAARKLTEIAFRRGSTDNITFIVVEFRHDNMSDGSPPSANQS